MNEEPELILDPQKWPIWVKLAVVAAFILLSFVWRPQGVVPPALFLVLPLSMGLVSIWKRQAYFAFRRSDDPVVFWGSIIACIASIAGLVGFALVVAEVL